ncbi:MAG: hypothetical protein Q7S83_00725 [bacterium]|nr:hypothetical protein [bacterium]
MDPEKKIYWSAPEFEYHEKTHVWFWMIVIGVIAMVAVALIQKNILFAIFAVLAGVLVLQWGKTKPDYVDFQLDEVGISVGGKNPHPWQEFSGFAIHRLHHEEEGLSELVLQRTGSLGTHWKFLVPNKDVDRVRHFSNQHLHEIEFEDSLIEHISRLLRF